MPASTPKALLYQRYGTKAQYRTEAVPDVPEDDSPRLLVPQPRQNKFRCCLELPEFSVTSDVFLKKKDAEHAAAKMATEKLGIHPPTDVLAEKPLTEEEKWQALKDRLSSTFCEQFLLSYCPLIAHFKAAVQRQGDNHGFVPAAVLSAFDTRVGTLCKSINSRAETNPALALALVLKAAKSCTNLHSPVDNLWIGKTEPFSVEAKEKLVNWTVESAGITDSSPEFSEITESFCFEAVYIPHSSVNRAESVTLKIEPHEYYMDVIARYLRVKDSSHVLISRTLNKAPSETRLYFPVPDLLPSISVLSENIPVSEKHIEIPGFELTVNARASNIAGQHVYGDAILAVIGSTWKSMGNLSCENISLSTFHRILLSRFPRGNYKISRDAILVAELPTAFTARRQWRGALPRDLLLGLCHQYRLSEPAFFICMDGLSWSPVLSKADFKAKQNLKVKKQAEVAYSNGTNDPEMLKDHKHVKSQSLEDMHNGELDELTGKGTFRCAVKILSKAGDLIINYVPECSYRNHNNAIQASALKALILLNECIENIDLHPENLTTLASLRSNSTASEMSHCDSLRSLKKEISLSDLPSVAFYGSDNIFNSLQSCSSGSYDTYQGKLPAAIHKDEADGDQDHEMMFLNIEGPDSGKLPTSGTIVCISYNVCLMGKSEKESLESREEFEFEFGSGAVIQQIETCVARMSVNQTACFRTPLPSMNLILAAAGENAQKIAHLSLGASSLEYNVTLLRLMEPLEERMEQALFSPPLSKQRVEYALRLLMESRAESLVDLGCGSGSLFDALLGQKTDLVHIAGVDISQKSLGRAAKIFHSKLGTDHLSRPATASFQSAFLYEGSITEPDQRLYGFDVATCIEVIEHMEEDQASRFGECVLGALRPCVLLVSTPNVEYNPILQRNVSDRKTGHEGEETREDAEGIVADLPCKFRNDDHKFEWTRKQFSDWALELASKYGYSVEFGGVGGSGEIEPGFASQMAVFKKCSVTDGTQMDARKCKSCSEGSIGSNISDLSYPYKEVWKWNAD